MVQRQITANALTAVAKAANMVDTTRTLTYWTDLVTAYEWVRDYPPISNYGICRMVQLIGRVECDWHVSMVAQQFPWHGLGTDGKPSKDYPVATMHNRDGLDLYSNTRNKWDKRSVYARNRLTLLDACIKDCKQRITKLTKESV